VESGLCFVNTSPIRIHRPQRREEVTWENGELAHLLFHNPQRQTPRGATTPRLRQRPNSQPSDLPPRRTREREKKRDRPRVRARASERNARCRQDDLWESNLQFVPSPLPGGHPSARLSPVPARAGKLTKGTSTVATLIVNAIAILSEDRFLARSTSLPPLPPNLSCPGSDHVARLAAGATRPPPMPPTATEPPS
jgi:hypothetical protein